MIRNYQQSAIMRRNYQLVYYDAENVGIIGILAYPKRVLFRFFKIVGLQNQLPIGFGTALVCTRVLKVQKITEHTQISNL